MSKPRLMQVTRVRLAEIRVGERLRPVRAAGVASIRQSIKDTGVMKDAVHLRKERDGYRLMAGAHRLAAAHEEGWEDIEAKVWADVTNDWALLMEIDDNLAGAEMNALETAVFLAERKRVYERLHPQTMKGVAGAASRWKDANDIVSFASVTAEKFGMSERNVQRLVKAGCDLTAVERDALLTGGTVTMKDLLVLSKIGEPEQRRQAITNFQQGCAFKDALRKVMVRSGDGKAKTADLVDQRHIAIRKAWAQAPKEARRRFVRDFKQELLGLLEGVTI